MPIETDITVEDNQQELTADVAVEDNAVTPEADVSIDNITMEEQEIKPPSQKMLSKCLRPIASGI